MRESHTIVAVRLKQRIIILLKRKRPAAELHPSRGGHPLNNQTERLLSVRHFTIGIIYELPSWPFSRSHAHAMDETGGLSPLPQGEVTTESGSGQ